MIDLPHYPQRVLSGQRPTGVSHIGHYFGILKNWVELQNHYDCWFMIADLHVLTTHYQNPWDLKKNIQAQLIDWLACGIDPNSSKIFLQSYVPQHAELHLLLSMITPLGWLERVPTYKEQQQQLKEKDINTYGFLGYPCLQTADIVLYHADFVPVGEDQLPHIELTREIVRRFNQLFGRGPDYQENIDQALVQLGKKGSKIFINLVKNYQEQGKVEDLEMAQSFIGAQGHLSRNDREYLIGWIEGSGKTLLKEPRALLTPTSRVVGLDGNRKMSKSYGNTIALREEPSQIAFKIKNMPTDPARIRRHDPGNPAVCPVFSYHQLYQDQLTCEQIAEECKKASIGCVECKSRLIQKMIELHTPFYEKGLEIAQQTSYLNDILQHGSKHAYESAKVKMSSLKQTLSLGLS